MWDQVFLRSGVWVLRVQRQLKTEICTQLLQTLYITPVVSSCSFSFGNSPGILACLFALSSWCEYELPWHWKYTYVNVHRSCLFFHKQKYVPLAEASPSSFTSVIWSCCVPSSSITATEKPTHEQNSTQREIQTLILLVLFDISQCDSVHCCSITTKRLDPLKAKSTHAGSSPFSH